MLKGLLKGSSLAFLLFGIFQTVTGNPAGAVFIVAGCIMDLQATAMDTNERLTALEKKGKESNDAA